MRIGELARHTGVSIHTLRYYERKGLLPQVARGPSNYREYGAGAIARLGVIRQAKELGFTLAQIARVLNVDQERLDCGTLRAIGQQKLADIDAQMSILRRRKRTLVGLLGLCDASTGGGCAVVRVVTPHARGRAAQA